MLKEKANIHIYKNKLRILITGSFIGLSIIILASVFIIIYKVGKPLLIEENTHLLEQYGNKIVARLGQKILMSETLATTLANLTEELDYDSTTYIKTIPHLIDFENTGDLITGGGIWPEPYALDKHKEKNSFFWGKDANQQFVYFNNYNLSEGKGYHHEEWYIPTKYMDQKSCFWSKSYMDPYSLQPMVTCTAPISINGQFKGAATIDLKLEGLNTLLQNAMKKSGGYAYTFDRNNKLLNFPDQIDEKNMYRDSSNHRVQEFLYADELAEKNPLFRPIADYLNEVNKNIIELAEKNENFNPQLAEIIANESYQINEEESKLIAAVLLDPFKHTNSNTNRLHTFYLDYDIIIKEPVIVSVFHMPRTYWKIVIVTPNKKSVAIINHISRKLLFIFSIVLLVLLIITFLLFRTNILVPLRKLSIQLKEIAHTPLQEVGFIDFKAKNEIGELVYWLNHRTSELKESTKALLENEQKYRTIFENTGTSLFIVDDDTTILLINDEFVKLTGYSHKEVEGKMKWTDFNIGVDLEKMELLHIQRRIDPDNAPNNYEFTFNNKAGKQLTVLAHVAMIPGTKVSIAALLDITERKQAEIELIKAKEQAEESDRLKTAFLQNISHEIRTPLNAISGFSDLLSDENTSPEDLKFFIQIIQSSSHQLLSIVTDILTIASLQAQQEKVDISLVNLSKVIDELKAIFISQTQQKGIELIAKKDTSKSLIEVYTDKTKLTQILANLLSNAIKFTDNGTIEFGYHIQEKSIEFYVVDTGIGIEPQFHEQIFKRFGQAKKDTSQVYSGTGLGLSISKGFVELLGGQIRVESTPGSGSAFYFTIPYQTK